MNKLTILLALTLLLTVPVLQAAKIYKWVDAEGNVNYSSTPPKADTKELNIHSAPSSTPAQNGSAAAPGENRQKFLDGLAKEREEKAKAEQKASEEQAINDENCKIARKNLAALKLGGRQYEMTPEGERRYLETEEVEARMKQNEGYVDEWCNKEE